MESQKSLKLNILKREKLMKTQAVKTSSESSSTDEKSDEELNKGSTIKLFQDKRKNFKSSKKDRSKKADAKYVGEKSEGKIVHIKSVEPVKTLQTPKESSITQAIKRKFAFFRKSENVKSTNDIEAAIPETNDTQESESGQILDVVVDVHQEHDEQKDQKIKKKSSSKLFDDVQQTDDTEIISSSESLVMKSSHLIEEFEEKKIVKKKNLKHLSDSDSDIDFESEIDISSPMVKNDKSIDELTTEILPTSGRDSSHRRRRWEKSEISANNLVEDLKKPRRRQWMKDSMSPDVHKVADKKISVSNRSATANLDKLPKSKFATTSTPIAAPRSKINQKQNFQAFDNDGFLFDQDEILRIETIENFSPTIKIRSSNAEKMDDKTSTLSLIEDNLSSNGKSKIEKLMENSLMMTESSDNSDIKEQSSMESSKSLDLIETKNVSRKCSNSKQKSWSEARFINTKDEPNEIDEDEDEQDTVLNLMEQKSRQSSGSSKVEIIPTNFFEKKFTDDTTISTIEEMNTTRKDRHRSRPRFKTKSSTHKWSDDVENTSDSSSQVKCKTTSSSTLNTTEKHLTNKKKAKAKKRKQSKIGEKEYLEDAEEDVKYISVRIHRSDILEMDFITRNPMVKVHIVNMSSGEYLQAHNKENNGSTVLQPIITGKFDFKERRSMLPMWEEELIFEQDYKDLLKEGKDSTLILFEIIDLLNYSEASVYYDRFGRDACWFKVAWAFLRPIGTSGVHHVDKKLRLQLYRPKKNFRKSNQNTCEVYRWWKSRSRDKYPSSLYVTVSSVDQPKLEPVFYEQLLPLKNVTETHNFSQELSDKTDTVEPSKWTRMASQPCQIPNDTYVEIEASENGCFNLAFSNDGKYLACALSEECDYPITVYKIQDGQIHVQFSGHKNFIYSLSWSQDDRFLLSVSSDRTARFWDVREKIIEHVQSLPHPSYVYCGKFSLEISNYIVTGCYDRVTRVWARLRSNSTKQYELIQELEVHESFVNSVCFQPKNEIFCTGDGVGVVIVWSPKRSRKSPIKKEWQIMRKIKIRELEGVPINTIVMHPLGSRILIHSRNNSLRLIDFLSGTIVKKFDGLMNQRIQITACISPCGNLLFCGGENSTLNVWSLETEKRLAVYEIDVHDKAVTCVDYHPTDHVLAFAIYGAPMPVKILKFDEEVDGKSVGLKLLTTTSNALSVNSISKLTAQSIIVKNGGKNLKVLSSRSHNSSVNVSKYDSVNLFLKDHKNNDDARVHRIEKIDKFIGNGPNLKTKSINRLNGIIEKIDRILMYATSHKSSAIDLESARNSSAVAVTERQPNGTIHNFELKDFTVEEHKKGDKILTKYRSRSERNSSSSANKETEFSKAFSDSAAFNHKISRFSADSSNSNESGINKKIIVERLELEKMNYVDTETEFKDSSLTIIDKKENFTSEEILDIESLKSDDTYVVEIENKSPKIEEREFSEESNATFVIESKIPIPKPRKRMGRIEVM